MRRQKDLGQAIGFENLHMTSYSGRLLSLSARTVNETAAVLEVIERAVRPRPEHTAVRDRGAPPSRLLSAALPGLVGDQGAAVISVAMALGVQGLPQARQGQAAAVRQRTQRAQLRRRDTHPARCRRRQRSRPRSSGRWQPRVAGCQCLLDPPQQFHQLGEGACSPVMRSPGAGYGLAGADRWGGMATACANPSAMGAKARSASRASAGFPLAMARQRRAAVKV